MKEHKSKRAHGTAHKGCNCRGAEQSKDTTQLIEFKWCAIESLDKPCEDQGFTRIRHGKKRRAGKVTIAEQIGRESGSHHADDDRPPHGRTARHQDTGGDARSRPEHRDAVCIVDQSEAKTRCEKEKDRD